MNIGIFGGTFNPPHLGHKRLLETAAQVMGFDKIIVIPTCVPPHKQAPDLAPGEKRLEMCRLTFGTGGLFEISDIELSRGEKSYTFDTVCQLKSIYPDSDFTLIIGSDMLESFTQWYRYSELLEMCRVCAASREEGFVPDLSGFTEAQRNRFTVLGTEPFEISSSEIRAGIKDGKDMSAFLSERTQAYIFENVLYFAGFDFYERIIEKKLDEYRLNHSRCVAQAAEKLAELYGCNVRSARTAGLLHDVMKNEEKPVQRAVIEQGGHELTEVEKANSKVWHAMAGEAWLRLNGIITAEDILGAVLYHTTGKADMTLLEKVVYIADFISADRTYPDVGTVRELAGKSLDEAILYTSAYTIKTLAASGLPIHPATVECYNYILTGKEK